MITLDKKVKISLSQTRDQYKDTLSVSWYNSTQPAAALSWGGLCKHYVNSFLGVVCLGGGALLDSLPCAYLALARLFICGNMTTLCGL